MQTCKSTIIILAALLIADAATHAAHAQSMAYSRVNTAAHTYVDLGDYDTFMRGQRAQYRQAGVAPPRGRHAHIVQPGTVPPGPQAAYPAFTMHANGYEYPTAHRNPHPASARPPTVAPLVVSPNVAAVNAEYALVGGATLALTTLPGNAGIEADRGRPYAPLSNMGQKASGEITQKVIRKVFLRMVPFVGVGALAYDVMTALD